MRNDVGISVLEQETKALTFIQRWSGRGDEEQEAQRFWIDLLQSVLNVQNTTEIILSEYKTVSGDFINAGKQMLAARANHPGQSLDYLYDPTFMPADLRKTRDSLNKMADVVLGAEKPCKTEGKRLRMPFDRCAEMTGRAAK